MRYRRDGYLTLVKVCVLNALVLLANCAEGAMFQQHWANSSLLSIPIIEECFYEETESVLLAGNWSRQVGDLHFRKGKSATFLIGLEDTDSLSNYKRRVKNYKIDPRRPDYLLYPVHFFIIAEFDLSALAVILHKIKSSVWWSVAGYFFFENKQYNSCKDAVDTIDLAWEFNILKATVLCHSSLSGMLMYTFNPYNEDAPEPWMPLLKFKKKNYPRALTVFTRPYDSNATELCRNLNFRKVHDLAGYPIKLCSMSSRRNALRSFFSDINELLWTKLNASISIEKINKVGIIDNDGVPSYATRDILYGKYDGFYIADYQRSIWRNEMNTFIRTGLCFITNKQPVTYMNRLFDIVSSYFVFELTVACVSTVIFFKHLLDIDFGRSVLNTLRVLIGHASLQEPVLVTSRIVFICIVLIYMFINFVLDSNLSSIMIEADPTRVAVRTQEELIDKNYTVYSRKFYEQYIYGSPLAYRTFQVANVSECLRVLKYGYKNACLDDCTLLKSITHENNEIHIAKVDMIEYFTLLYRDDFPLKGTVSVVYHRLLEHGLVKRLIKKYFHRLRYEEHNEVIVISLQQLWIAFFFLGAGSFVASLAFCVELCNKYYLPLLP